MRRIVVLAVIIFCLIPVVSSAEEILGEDLWNTFEELIIHENSLKEHPLPPFDLMMKIREIKSRLGYGRLTLKEDPVAKPDPYSIVFAINEDKDLVKLRIILSSTKAAYYVDMEKYFDGNILQEMGLSEEYMLFSFERYCESFEIKDLESSKVIAWVKKELKEEKLSTHVLKHIEESLKK